MRSIRKVVVKEEMKTPALSTTKTLVSTLVPSAVTHVTTKDVNHKMVMVIFVKMTE